MAKTKYSYKYNGQIVRNSNNVYRFGLVNHNDVVIACSGTATGAIKNKTSEEKRCKNNINYCMKKNKLESVEHYKKRLEDVQKWHVVELELIQN